MIKNTVKRWLGLGKQSEQQPMNQDEWFKLICKSYSHPPVVFNGSKLPDFPSDTIQINTTGQAGAGTLKEANFFHQECTREFNEMGSPARPEHKLLDFGVGWGRIARFFMYDFPLQNIYGVDVTKESVDLCKDTFHTDNFYLCEPFPPTRFEDGKFNYIVGYSVFSHLSEQASADWMKEFHRILAPGGVVAVTTRGRSFFDFCEAQKGKGNKGYMGALSRLFEDFADARKRYDNGEFVHSNIPEVSGGGAMNTTFYGESFIPEAYVREAYADCFDLVKFNNYPTHTSQSIMFLRKK